MLAHVFFFFFSSRRRHTRFDCDWSSDVCSSDLHQAWTFWPTSKLAWISSARTMPEWSQFAPPWATQLLNSSCAWAVLGRDTPSWRALLRDRKSTRLNSSHSQISYAVFCLKKKKNQKPDQQSHSNPPAA